MKTLLSFTKSIFLSFLFILAYPLVLLLPKYDAYVFVVTTGRSGSGSLANLLKASNRFYAVHEPYPILNNSLRLNKKWQKVWIAYQFYLVKLPLIYISKIAGKQIYLETNHLFVKMFYRHAQRTFKSKLKLIYMERPVEQVAKSIYEIGKLPGDKLGNKWYLNPYDIDNKINFHEVFNHLNDPQKGEWEKFYRCIWYWYEIQERARELELAHVMLKLQTSELNDLEKLEMKLKDKLSINGITIKKQFVDKNQKRDEKKFFLNENQVKEKTDKFREALDGLKNNRVNEVGFSVVIPLYNKDRYIAKTIQSVLDQTHSNFELIIIDDGSTDNSISEVLRLAARDSRIFVESQENLGVSAARNRGIRKAIYNWICFLDSDDCWHQSYLETLASKIRHIPEYIAIAANYSRVSSGSKIKTKKSISDSYPSGCIRNYFKSAFFGQQVLTSSSVCVNKESLARVGELELFPEGVKRGEDLDSWVRLALKGDIYFINERLVLINNVEGSTSSSFDYAETFQYSKWYRYEAGNLNQSFYLKMYAVKKRLKIIRKLVAFRQYKNVLKVVRDIVSSR